ncbi:ABC-2 type transport system permease protein [Geodermatophilus saharensis]|uniref:ABC-2 type transport system permease protein n=1 Tax=Geodermatophilus saharensis TaxID=1137994 RepID=A0A239GLP1_9ACTN|nr:ABC transporter permease [Geodermatophilus saharensis]SNS69732.1 ABC-2 type transport system permease protein [Geodermatophilus saharensis]
MSAPLSSGQLVRLVAAREVSTRLRDKTFLVSSAVMLLIILGILVFQAVVNSGSDENRIGVVGDPGALGPALEAQGELLGRDVTVVGLDDDVAARTAVEDEDVDAAVLGATGGAPELLVRESDPTVEGLVSGAVGAVALQRVLTEAGVDPGGLPQLTVTALDESSAAAGQRTAVALVGVVLLYSLIVLFGQFVAQGVVEEKASRVVELLLATMRPWHLLAGKILGLGALGLAQIALIAVIGVGGALAFDVVDVPGDLIGTVGWVLFWFVLGYALFASLFAVAASLVSRQEDLGSVLTPATLVLFVGFVVAIQAAGDPDGTAAVVTSFVPGLSPMVMPVRQAAGDVAAWEVAVAVVLMLVAIALVVRLGGRVYSGALLRTSGKTKLKEALRAGRA